MIAPLRRILRICLGALLILLGIVGLFLPILQGVAMIAAGILLLAPNSRISVWLRRTARRGAAQVGRTVRRWKSGPGRKLRRPFKWIAAKMRRMK